MTFEHVLPAWLSHERELRTYLVHRLGDVHAADDLLQEVFLKLIRQGAAFSGIGNARAWLFRVARNALIDQARGVKPHVGLPDDLVAPEQDERAPVDELDACVQRNLSEMHPDDRAIIDQCDLQGIKQQAFAQAHGLSLAAAKSRLLRARQRLREALVRNCQVRFDETGRVCCHTPRHQTD